MATRQTLWLGALLLISPACDLEGSASEVIFSPQPPATSHNLRIAELIADARESIDIAVYGLDSAAIEAALRDAVARGVKIRLIHEGARADQNLDADARASSQSGRLEAAGVDVRFVNKIMHHKFMIVDGPRDELAKAATAMLVTGSANWSHAAATRYDENTLFLRGHEELALRLQREFNLLWEHSRDFVGDHALPFVASEISIREADIVDSPNTHALFTSANFEVVEESTFTATGRSTISDAMIAAIAGATNSIRIASGHLRDRGIASALMARAADIEVRVYLDAQDYVSVAAYLKQVKQVRGCLNAAADDESAKNACRERGYRFGYMIDRAGVDVRYKWYSYRWVYAFAEQMHHKYMIIDGDELWTGSYNLSNNAEHNTMENMLVFTGPEHTGLIRAYVANFEQLWVTGREAGLLDQLREQIVSADVIPLHFEPMALEWEEIRDLQALIRANCPRVRSFADPEPGSDAVCNRE